MNMTMAELGMSVKTSYYLRLLFLTTRSFVGVQMTEEE